MWQSRCLGPQNSILTAILNKREGDKQPSKGACTSPAPASYQWWVQSWLAIFRCRRTSTTWRPFLTETLNFRRGTAEFRELGSCEPGTPNLHSESYLPRKDGSVLVVRSPVRNLDPLSSISERGLKAGILVNQRQLRLERDTSTSPKSDNEIRRAQNRLIRSEWVKWTIYHNQYWESFCTLQGSILMAMENSVVKGY